jgi:hypothetical protein
MDSVLRRLLPEGEKILDDSCLQGLFFGNFMEPDANPRIYDEVCIRYSIYLFINLILSISFKCLDRRPERIVSEDAILPGRA